MPITAANITANATWSLQKTNTGNAATTQGPDQKVFNLNNLVTNTFNQISVTEFTVGASGTTNVDLTSLTNLVSESFSLAHVLSIMVMPANQQITLAPGVTNGLVWFFGGTTPSVTIQAGGCFLFSISATDAGQVVDGSHKVLSFTAPGGGASTVTLVLLGSTT